MSRKPNFDVNVDRRTDERTNGRTEIWTPISHPAISRCDKNDRLPTSTETTTAAPEPWTACTLKQLSKKYPVTTQELLAELELSDSDPDSETDEEDIDHHQNLLNRLF